MRRTVPKVLRPALVALLAVAALILPSAGARAAAAPAKAPGRVPVVWFRLVPADTATAPAGGMMASPGDTITVTGGGWFAPRTGEVSAKGDFVHRTSAGAVHCEGTWEATALTGWTDFGSSRRGRHGGVISLLVTHTCVTMGEVHTDIPMTVTSAVHAPSGSTARTGITVGEFTEPTGGDVVIRPGYRPVR